MFRHRSRVWGFSLLGGALALAGCGDADVPAIDAKGPESPVLHTSPAERTLKRGDVGEDVERVYRFARRYGYFPNPELEAVYRDWHPVIPTAPADPQVFDDLLEQAVFMYQGANGLQATGEVDAATLALMKQPRCGVPDLYTPPPMQDPHVHPDQGESPYVLHGTQWPNGALTFKFTSFTGDMSTGSARSAVTRAFARWAGVGGLSFSEVPAFNPANIAIGWFSGDHFDGSPFDGPGGTLAHGFYPPNGSLHFDEAETWVNGASPGTIDLESVALHEIGHTLGLGHSALSSAVMFSSFAGGTVKNILTQDDIDGIRALYGPTWTYSWSSAGPLPGKSCTQTQEPSDPDSWGDNWFCSDVPTGMVWSNAGALSSTFWKCTAISEPSDPDTWNDNFICLPRSPAPPPGYDVNFTWSFSGPIAGKKCVQWYELSDPHTWNDNFLCW